MLFVGLLCAASLVGCRAAGPGSSKTETGPERFAQAGFEPCWIGSERAFCGSVSVPAVHGGSERALDLAVAVLPAKAPKPTNDPVVLLAGGPGQGSIEASPALSKVWTGVRRHRDVLLVDQRGTGGSHPLHCAFENDETLDAAFDLEFDEPELRACREAIAARDLDPAWFTSAAAADDLEQVRVSLGYDALNLYGVSYGTRLALVFARRHPDAVRSMVLDAVAPTTMVLPLSMVEDGQRAFDDLLAACEADARCGAAYPELERDARTLLEGMHAEPHRTTLEHPVTGDSEAVAVDGDAAAGFIRGALYSPLTAAMIPHAIDQAAAGDMRPLTGLAAVGAGNGDSLATGLFLSIICGEDVPRIEAASRQKSLHSPFGRTSVPQMELACKVWDVPPVGPEHAQPVSASVPTLVLSGRFDPVTPPRWGDEVAQTITPSRHIVVEDGGHGAFSAPCMDGVVTSFVEQPDAVADLDASCVVDHGRPDFVLPIPQLASTEEP